MQPYVCIFAKVEAISSELEAAELAAAPEAAELAATP